MVVKDWDEYFMGLCYHASTRSKDKSTTVGCVIVGPDNEIRTTGYNGFVRGFEDEPHHHERPLKYDLTEHSERNAFYNAARVGTPLKGCKIYVAWLPCTDCARAIIQSGIKEVILHKEHPTPAGDWASKQAITMEMFTKCGVEVRVWSGIIQPIMGLISGRVFDPSTGNFVDEN